MEAVKLKLWGVVEGLELSGGDGAVEIRVEYGNHLDVMTLVEGQRTTIHYPLSTSTAG